MKHPIEIILEWIKKDQKEDEGILNHWIEELYEDREFSFTICRVGCTYKENSEIYSKSIEELTKNEKNLLLAEWLKEFDNRPKVTKNEIKELRIQIDGLSQLVKELKPIESNMGKSTMPDGREVSWIPIGLQKYIPRYHSYEIRESYNNLILAKAWLGIVLQELGEETPYKNDGNRKTVEDIELPADISIHSGEVEQRSTPFNRDSSHIEKVDWLRERIKNIIEITVKVLQEFYNINDKKILCDYYSIILQHLSEARSHLGFELGRCRDENNK